jgi:hypothetical protein
MKENAPIKNTDVELFREREDYYAPSIHVTAEGNIGMNVGGLVIVLSIREWHKLGKQNMHIRQIQSQFLTEEASSDD